MAKKKRVLLKSKELREVSGVAGFLRELAEKMESGEVVLQQGENEVVVGMADSVMFKIKVTEKRKPRGVKRQLKMNLKWSEGRKGDGSVTVR